MHDVYIIKGLTGEEAFRKDAYRRLREGEGFTVFHHHHAETRGERPMPIPCTTACVKNDPYPGHLYVKSPIGVMALGEGTCEVYNHLDPLFFQDGNPPALGHCLECHCSCYAPESDLTLDDACSEHGEEGCPVCRQQEGQ